MYVNMCVTYKVGENATDDLEYWLSPETTAANESTLPGVSDTTKHDIGPESVDDGDQAASVCSTFLYCTFINM